MQSLYDLLKKTKEGNAPSDRKKENPHRGHRERMRLRLLKDPDMETFAEHEILEMILFHGIPRKDTNEIAHALLKKFGSYRNVFDASYQDLLSVKGMTKSAASLIKMFLPAVRRYNLSIGQKKPKLQSVRALTKQYAEYFVSQTREVAIAVLMNLNGEVLDTLYLGKGTATNTEIDIEKLVQSARMMNAVRVVIMHNHPANGLFPSISDLVTTKSVILQLMFAKIALWDHIIFGMDGRYFSFQQNNLIQRLVTHCNEFLQVDVYGLYDKIRIPESISEKSVQLSQEEYARLEEKIADNTRDKVFMQYLIDECRENAIIGTVAANEGNAKD